MDKVRLSLCLLVIVLSFCTAEARCYVIIDTRDEDSAQNLAFSIISTFMREKKQISGVGRFDPSFEIEVTLLSSCGEAGPSVEAIGRLAHERDPTLRITLEDHLPLH